MRLGIPDSAEDLAQRSASISILKGEASEGDVEAQVALAWEYARGDVVRLDMAEALRWFDRAAASGDRRALTHRARFLQLRHVPEGVRALRRLAAEGEWLAQFWLARYLQTKPGRLNQLRAVVWFDRSFKNGNPGADVAKLRQLTSLAPLLSKPVLLARAIIATIAFVGQLFRRDDQAELMKPLMYHLKNGNG
jgi:TPR repeat protein